jgi:hypothetical protein
MCPLAKSALSFYTLQNETDKEIWKYLVPPKSEVKIIIIKTNGQAGVNIDLMYV